ncbi:carbonic anhydrase 4-like [Engraulis encrasicolus]|uniref:carbonic anhydrase 4-like n=1 Tax=Engraulis encrasicolus TaxID=184585 RepID=UPI002FD327CB
MYLIFLLLVANAVVLSGASEDWCYTGCESSPSHWHDHFPRCGGEEQSPINIDTKTVNSLKALNSFQMTGFEKKDVMKRLSNNGHSVTCELESGAVNISGGGLHGKYMAAQFHFHWGRTDLMHFPGSEHSIDGHRLPIEMHIVSLKEGLNMTEVKNDSSGLAVLGFFIDEGNGTADQIQAWDTFTKLITNVSSTGDNVDMSLSLSINDLLGSLNMKDYYRYNGSLTTPTCDEVVVWTVFPKPIRISKDLIQRFAGETSIQDNYRPQQTLHDRKVYASANMDVTNPESGHHWCYAGCGEFNNYVVMTVEDHCCF